MATGGYHSLALKSDGTVWAWGLNNHGQLGNITNNKGGRVIQVTDLDNVIAIDAGEEFSLALKNDGTLWAWGRNRFGQLGDGTLISRSTPVQVKGENNVGFLSNITSISAGQHNSLALSADGRVWSWGCNEKGQLGNGSNNHQLTPVRVEEGASIPLTKIKAIFAGFEHGLALRSDGRLFAWGSNEFSQLGNGNKEDRNWAEEVGLVGVTKMAAGRGHTIALTDDGKLWAWGKNDWGLTGNGVESPAYTPQGTPKQLDSLHNIVNIQAGADHNIVLQGDGTIWAWGRNKEGELGDGAFDNEKKILPVRSLISLARQVKTLDTGYYHNNVILDGKVWSWGWNAHGQMGDSSKENKTTPVQITGLENIVSTAGGGGHTLALRSDGTVWAWGKNDSGQLGDKSLTNRSSPVQVSNVAGTGFLTNIIAIAAGDSFSLALSSDGKLFAWGSNVQLQLGSQSASSSQSRPLQIPNVHDIISIATGRYSSYALKSDGTVLAWGFNRYGQLGIASSTESSLPALVKINTTTELKNIKSIGAGCEHGLALTADGTLYSWGWNSHGQIGNNTTTNRNTAISVSINGNRKVTQIDGGFGRSIALTGEGKVFIWGRYNHSTNCLEITDHTSRNLVPTEIPLGKAMYIKSGAVHTLAVVSEGKIMAWGRNSEGELGSGDLDNSITPVKTLVPLGAPSNLRTTYNKMGYILLSWDPVKNVAGYRIYKDGQLYLVLNSPSSEAIVSNLYSKPGDKHIYYVTAVNEKGIESMPSKKVIGVQPYLRGIITPLTEGEYFVFQGIPFGILESPLSVSRENGQVLNNREFSLEDIEANKIHILHSARDSAPFPSGTKIGEVEIYYKDGTSLKKDMVLGVDTADWAWEKPHKTISHCYVPPAYAWDTTDNSIFH